MVKNVRIAVILLPEVILFACLLASCPEAEEKPSSLYAMVELLPGSPGYGGDGAVYGLLNGTYIVMHQKKQTRQEKDPAGRIRVFHETDWYAVVEQKKGGKVERVLKNIASSTDGIPANAQSALLEDGKYPPRIPDFQGVGADIYSAFHADRYRVYAVNSITGLVNGETYGVYRYGALSNGESVGRHNGRLHTEDANTVVNLKGLKAGQSIGMYDVDVPDGRIGLLNSNNRLVVLVPTGLRWTETPQTVFTNVRLRGYKYDVIIEDMDFTDGNAQVAAVESEGQQYFILTGNTKFAGYIRIVEKQ